MTGFFYRFLSRVFVSFTALSTRYSFEWTTVFCCVPTGIVHRQTESCVLAREARVYTLGVHRVSVPGTTCGFRANHRVTESVVYSSPRGRTRIVCWHELNHVIEGRGAHSSIPRCSRRSEVSLIVTSVLKRVEWWPCSAPSSRGSPRRWPHRRVLDVVLNLRRVGRCRAIQRMIRPRQSANPGRSICWTSARARAERELWTCIRSKCRCATPDGTTPRFRRFGVPRASAGSMAWKRWVSLFPSNIFAKLIRTFYGITIPGIHERRCSLRNVIKQGNVEIPSMCHHRDNSRSSMKFL